MHIHTNIAHVGETITLIFNRTLWFRRLLYISTYVLLFGCANQDLHSNLTDKSSLNRFSPKKVISIEFTSVPLSKNDEEISKMRISPLLSVTYSDGSVSNHPLSYHKLLKMGDIVGQGTFGLITDSDGNAIIEKDGSQFVSQDPDGNSFITVEDQHFLITHMESMPGAIYKTELVLKKQLLEAIDTAPIDLNAVDGTVINCASSKTPWNTHIGGEEDFNLNSVYAFKESQHYHSCAVENKLVSRALVTGSRSYFCTYVSGMQSYLKENTIDKNNGYNGDRFSPYNYGYTVEVGVNPDDTTSVARHYVTGKYTPELGLAMPDKKTIYMSDDGNAKGLWKFVSDEKINGFKENWQGTLYAAKVKQLSDRNGGSFSMSWIKLGHASDTEIKNIVDQKLVLTDIFDVAFPENLSKCSDGFTRIYEDDIVSCLRLKEGQELTAAFLESRKYAAYLGATTEFRKEEGLAYDPANNKLYVAMTQLDGSVLDNFMQQETNNDIRLPLNICGGIYELTLDQDFNATSMKAVLTGKPLNKGERYSDENYCSPEAIANPDNLAFLGSDTLIVSEDTKKHLNNMSWAYNVKTKKLTRIASLPIGAELTGVTNAIVGNRGFLFMTQQHPFADQPVNLNNEKTRVDLLEKASDDDLNAVIGYIEGIPSEVLLE
ncbi:MAG: DUF839 domain-containing protein [Kangiellaceae bacterium]|nr:DUF839 domain-containing protein [Kangiellaceae bacterium]